jgi:aspartate/methionine/tyrosine aminotransferase
VFTLPAPDGGDPQLRDALSSFFNTYFRPVHTVQSEHIVLTAGATDAIESVIHAVCDDGDSVLVPGPSWRRLHALHFSLAIPSKLTRNIKTVSALCSKLEQMST